MDARDRLIKEIEAETSQTASFTGRRTLDPRTLAAVRRVRRQAFMGTADPRRAYENRPFAIGYGQTISQPFIVALMTDFLDLTPDSKVLEIGTGSGYQAAVLAELAEQVWSVEVIPELSRRAAAALAAEGYTNVNLKVANGSAGWPEMAPFDAIIVTAAGSSIPPNLIDQLRAPGRMVIPVGERYGDQMLLLVEKDAAGTVGRHQILAVAFVPLVDAPALRHATDQ